MRFRFMHAADVHLGFHQYNNSERYNDFARAFERLVDEALAQRVDFLLLAGDLFHQRTIEPLTLLQATVCLQRLRDGGVPAIAVEGNHERPLYTDGGSSGAGFSWLDYLVESGLLVVLNPTYHDGRLALPPWDGAAGAYLDLPCGARVVGAKYYGASTGRVVEDLAEALPALQQGWRGYTVLLLHAGLQGILDNYSATLRRSQLELLRPYADYVALGHIHKPFSQDEWLYNPGSLETNSAQEVEWAERGYYLVQVEATDGVAHAPSDAREGPRHVARLVPGPRRAFLRLALDLGPYERPEAFHSALAAYLQREATPERVAQQPVVELQLWGRLAFSPADLDLAHVERQVQALFKPVQVLVRNQTAASEADVPTQEGASREELELEVVSGLLRRDVRYLADSERWARLALRLKRLALDDHAPSEIIAELSAFRAEPIGDESC